MKELMLYRFINDNNVEWHRRDNEGQEDVVIMPYIFQLEEFAAIVRGFRVDDGGLPLVLRENYVCIWMNEICDYYGLDINQIFIGDSWE